jgi:predicted transglutaminase-like cysteine proteinase
MTTNLPAPLRRQTVLRPLVGAILLGVVAATLATGSADAAGFMVTATAPSRDSATAALAGRAARECGFRQADRGWYPHHRMGPIGCAPGNPARCTARVTCIGEPPAALAAR